MAAVGAAMDDIHSPNFPKLAQMMRGLQDVFNINYGNDAGWEYKTLVKFFEHEKSKLPFKEGDYVKIKDLDSLKDGAYNNYREEFEKATLRIKRIHWNSHFQYWSAECRLVNFYPEYYGTNNKKPIYETSKLFVFSLKRLEASTEQAHKKWVKYSKKHNSHLFYEKRRKENEKKKQCENEKKKQCDCCGRSCKCKGKK